jgi:hypothetical protein
MSEFEDEQFQLNVLDQVRGCTPTTYRETRADVVAWYQDEYGAVDWVDQIIADLMIQTGKSRNTVSREFQYDRRIGQERYKGTRVNKATAAKYRQLGREKTPAIYTAPEGGY